MMTNISVSLLIFPNNIHVIINDNYIYSSVIINNEFWSPPPVLLIKMQNEYKMQNVKKKICHRKMLENAEADSVAGSQSYSQNIK